ncbi:glycyl-radical enzyme activating protein [Eubacteriales bacterium OttesenSCG-928-N13]|nr:glycyl-radical enzyme activating protein [Eubacteriales bacterium OttesenSCG-928-N13]
MSKQSAMIFNIQKFCLHDGPGIRTTVFFSGCPLRCGWCSNPESQQLGFVCELDGIQSARSMEISDIMDEVRKDLPFYQTSGGGLTLSGGEMLMQPDAATALIDAARKEGIHTCAESCCYAADDVFRRVVGGLDLLLADLKHHDAQKHKMGTGADLAPILANLKWLTQSGIPYRIRIPVIPGFNDSTDDARAFGRLLSEIGAKNADLLMFHQYGDKKYDLLNRSYTYRDATPIQEEDLDEYQHILKDAGLHVVID